MLKDFSELIAKQRNQPIKRVAVVNGTDDASLLGVFDNRLQGKVEPILIGDRQRIESQLDRLNISAKGEIIEASEKQAATIGVELARLGQVEVLMKGHIQTSDFLRPVVAKETGIIAEDLLTHVVLNQVAAYPKLLLTTDGGMVPEPTLADKQLIIRHGLEVLQRLGYEKPRVAVLAAAETVNPKIKSSQEAEQLSHYFKEQSPIPCEIDGPLSFDLAISPEIAALKGYESPVAGQADMLVGPDMTAMNLVGKSMMTFGGGKMAGIVCGAKVPIVMTSRGSSSEEKYLSIVLASLVG